MVQSTLLNFFAPRSSAKPNENEVTITQRERAPDTNNLPNTQAQEQSFDQEKTDTVETEAGTPASEDVVGPSLLDITPYATPHSSLAVGSVTKESLPQLKRITGTLLPIRYPDEFFEETITVDPIRFLSRQVVFGFPEGQQHGIPVGWIRCRLEAFPLTRPPESVYPGPTGSGDQQTQIYIQALCLLAPYRGYGAAASLLDAILSDETVLSMWNVRGVYAHVWEKNHEGLSWYKKRGFKKTVLIDGYYRKLKPTRAWIVWRPLDSTNE